MAILKPKFREHLQGLMSEIARIVLVVYLAGVAALSLYLPWNRQLPPWSRPRVEFIGYRWLWEKRWAWGWDATAGASVQVPVRYPSIDFSRVGFELLAWTALCGIGLLLTRARKPSVSQATSAKG